MVHLVHLVVVCSHVRTIEMLKLWSEGSATYVAVTAMGACLYESRVLVRPRDEIWSAKHRPFDSISRYNFCSFSKK